MDNKIGKITGFLTGAIGFLIIFKLFFLTRIDPGDELAPGMVVLIAIFIGIVTAWTGGQLQDRIRH